MNQLDVSQQHSIATLSAKGWSAREIARDLGVNRETVGRYLRLGATSSKPANAPIGSKAGRTSHCAPLSDVIKRGLEAGLWLAETP